MKNVSFAYLEEDVLKNVNLKIKEGELVTLSGENGSGKSTLLKLILGEILPNKGEIKLFGKTLSNRTDFSKVGYVPQVQVMNQMAFNITCLELVVLNLYRKFGYIKIPTRNAKGQAIAILNRLDLENYIHTPFNELSGGLKQRTMIARALVNRPELLIFDEPTANIDKDSKIKFLKLISQMHAHQELTILIVSHDSQVLENMWNINHRYQLRDGDLISV